MADPDVLNTLITRIQDDLQSGSAEIPVLPVIAQQALQLVHAPDPSAGKLADLLHKDQGLAANVIRMANSTMYRRSSPVVSLQQSIARIGIRNIGDIVMSACVKGSVFTNEKLQPQLEPVWRHSLATALFAKEIARHDRRNVEVAFLCGLLERMGRPVVAGLAFTVAKADKLKLSNEDYFAVMDSLETDVGEKVVAAWDLPSPVLSAVRYRGNFLSASEDKYEVTVTAAANLLADALLERQDDISHLPQEAPFAELNHYPEDIEAHWSRHERIQETLDV